MLALSRNALTNLVLLICFSLLLQANSALANFRMQAEHKLAMDDVVTGLVRHHYSRKKLDKELSATIYDLYIDTLDPSRLFFLESDILEFERLQSRLIDELKTGSSDLGFTLFNRYYQRHMAQLDFALALLEDNKQSFDFTSNAEILLDRTEAPWFQTTEEANQYWFKRIVHSLITLKLSDQSDEEAKETLINRYTNQRNRLLQTNNEDVFERYASAVANAFDPHSQYMSPRSQENFQINMSLSLEGIGAVLRSEDDYTLVVRLVPGGPADLAGQLRPGDKIVGVGQQEDGKIEDVVGWRLDEVVNLIRGPRNSTVRIQVIPSDAPDSSFTQTYSITRDQVRLEEQASQKRIIDIERDGENYRVGVIEIPAFYIDFAALQAGDPNYKSTTRDVERLIAELQEENIDSLVIDLRNNGGGSLREASELTGLFIRLGPTVQIRDYSGRVEIQADFDTKISWTGPMAVLVNRLSASASEIFAGAIADYNRGLVIGNPTFGKGTVQTLIPIQHGQLKLTHAKFYRISGNSSQNKGVIPHIEFPSTLSTSDIGESTLKNALPGDAISRVKYQPLPNFNYLLDEIRTKHEERIESNPDFQYIFRQNALNTQESQQVTSSLNIDTIRSLRTEIENKRLSIENERRISKGEKPIDSLDQLNDILPKDYQGRTLFPENESMLIEAADILIDFINLSVEKRKTAQIDLKAYYGNRL